MKQTVIFIIILLLVSAHRTQKEYIFFEGISEDKSVGISFALFGNPPKIIICEVYFDTLKIDDFTGMAVGFDETDRVDINIDTINQKFNFEVQSDSFPYPQESYNLTLESIDSTFKIEINDEEQTLATFNCNLSCSHPYLKHRGVLEISGELKIK